MIPAVFPEGGQIPGRESRPYEDPSSHFVAAEFEHLALTSAEIECLIGEKLSKVYSRDDIAIVILRAIMGNMDERKLGALLDDVAGNIDTDLGVKRLGHVGLNKQNSG